MGPRATGRPAAFFDLDKTIIAKSSTLAFSKSFQAGGLISRRAVLRSAYAQFVYLVGGADHDQMEKMREFLSELCAGWDVQTVRDIVAETLHNIVDPLVYDEAVSLIEEHQLAGRDVMIVSASGSEVVEPIGEMLGADAVIATRMEIADGRYTGEIDFYAYAENKATAIARPRRGAGLRPRPQLRLLRLRHRPAHARGRRAPLRGQPRPRAAPAWPPSAAGRCWSSPGRWRCAARMRLPREQADPGRAGARHRGRRGRSGLRRGAPTGHARRVVGRRRSVHRPVRRRSPVVTPRPSSSRGCRRPEPRRTKETQLTDPHMSQVPTRRPTLPIGRRFSGFTRDDIIWCTLGSHRSHVSAAALWGNPRVPLACRAGGARTPAAISGLASAPCA